MTYTASYTGIGLLLKSPDMQAGMHQLALKVLARAQATAPVETGAYKASLRATSGVENDRAYGRVTADVPYAHDLEYGTSDTSRHRTLGRALDAVRE